MEGVSLTCLILAFGSFMVASAAVVVDNNSAILVFLVVGTINAIMAGVLLNAAADR